MKFAVISDIHGNADALEAVLKDIESKRVDVIYCTGDIVGYGPYPNQVVERIRCNEIPTVRGNYDHSVGSNTAVCGCRFEDGKKEEVGVQSLIWSQGNTTSQNKKWLSMLPVQIWLELSNRKILFVHGSTRTDKEYLFEDSAALEEIAEEANFDILICGHTHKPFHKTVKGIHFINAGSVGKPKHKPGDPRGTYVIVNVEEDSVQVSIEYVSYDYEKAAQAVIDAGLPEQLADNLRGIL
ncbi:MAG: metallophosphoesterase family protein [Bacillota bacterium]